MMLKSMFTTPLRRLLGGNGHVGREVIGCCLVIAVDVASQTAGAATFLDDFSTDTSANYTYEDSFGSGGSFSVAGGTLNITTDANNTATVTLTAAQSLAVGESIGVDVVGVDSPEGVFLTLGTSLGQPGDTNDGYRWRRDTVGETNIRIQRDDLGIIIGPSPDPDHTRNATLWIDRLASDTFEFLIQLEGETSRTSYGTDTYAALDGVNDLHIGMQAFDGSADTFAFDNLRIVDTSTIPEPATGALVLLPGMVGIGVGRRRGGQARRYHPDR